MLGERILLVDDDDLIRSIVGQRLDDLGYQVSTAKTLAEARRSIAAATPDVALLDIKLPDGEGTELLEPLAQGADVPCIMITAHGTVESAVGALKQGASHYLEKPFSMERVEATVRSALERTRLQREVRTLRRQSATSGMVVGPSPAMQEVMRLVEKIAPADRSTVLIEGETGTGKGVLARSIHEMGPRAEGPFITVTCSALAGSLFESELFGHEKGAFTDARTMKRGLVEVASGGTLFLDEIAELPTNLQGKLLRLIEEKAFRRVGGTADLKVDARVVAATNRDLDADVAAGEFRQDLYYRLHVLPLKLPPLRHRRPDIPGLAKTFTERFSRELGKRIEGIDPKSMSLLEKYAWPGNVRELRNVIERAVLLSERPVLTPDLLTSEIRNSGETPQPHGTSLLGPEGLNLEFWERRLLREALQRTQGNQTKAGRLLGISRHQMRNRLIKYGGDL